MNKYQYLMHIPVSNACTSIWHENQYMTQQVQVSDQYQYLSERHNEKILHFKYNIDKSDVH